MSGAAPNVDASSPPTSRRVVGLWLLVLGAAGIAAYANSFWGVFIFDDVRHIVDNRDVADLGAAVRTRRALVSVTLALNHRLGGLDPAGYHAVNLGVHLLAGFVLFGLVRRTLLLPDLRATFGSRAHWIAGSAALLWLVHPLQTSSVTYVIQRAESMMGLFYLLTLYLFLRGATAGRGALWFGAAVAACGLGMVSKAVMVTAPAVVLLYDRVFLAGSFAEVARRRWAVHAGLVLTWGLLFVTGVAPAVLVPGERRLTAGFGYGGITPWAYALAQAEIVPHYIRLVFWPHPLCLDYYWPPVAGIAEALLPGVVLAVLVGAAGWALWKRPRLGFLAASFFVVLSPTSSIVPIKDLAFEHRMYLPLAAVIVLVTIAGDGLLGRLALRGASGARVRALGVVLVALAAGALAYGTIQRNRDYASTVAMWGDVVAQRPENPRAHTMLGTSLARTDAIDEGIVHLREALRLRPRLPVAHANLATALGSRGEIAEAIEHYNIALQSGSRLIRRHVVHLGLAQLMVREGRTEEAIENFRRSLAIDPELGPAHLGLGNQLLEQGRLDEAVQHLREAVRLTPEDGLARGDLGRGLAAQGALDEALEQLEEAVRLTPDDASVRNNLAGVLMARDRVDEAIEQVVEAIRVDPEHVDATQNLAIALARQGRIEETIDRYRDRAPLERAHALAYVVLGDRARATGRIDAAVAAWRRALTIDPTLAAARTRLEAVSSPGE